MVIRVFVRVSCSLPAILHNDPSFAMLCLYHGATILDRPPSRRIKHIDGEMRGLPVNGRDWQAFAGSQGRLLSVHQNTWPTVSVMRRAHLLDSLERTQGA